MATVLNLRRAMCVAGLVGGMALFTVGALWFNFVRWSPWPGVVITGVSGAIISSVIWGLVPLV